MEDFKVEVLLKGALQENGENNHQLILTLILVGEQLEESQWER